jgi:hypothetical protein
MGLEERGIFDRRNMKDMNLQLQSRQTEFVALLAQDDGGRNQREMEFRG